MLFSHSLTALLKTVFLMEIGQHCMPSCDILFGSEKTLRRAGNGEREGCGFFFKDTGGKP